jgi:hypothetical protein
MMKDIIHVKNNVIKPYVFLDREDISKKTSALLLSRTSAYETIF